MIKPSLRVPPSCSPQPDSAPDTSLVPYRTTWHGHRVIGVRSVPCTFEVAVSAGLLVGSGREEGRKYTVLGVCDPTSGRTAFLLSPTQGCELECSGRASADHFVGHWRCSESEYGRLVLLRLTGCALPPADDGSHHRRR